MLRTNPDLVKGVRSDSQTPPNPYASGYGSKIPTRYWLYYQNRWRRVYVMQYANSGTAYILVKGEQLVLDIDTEYRLA